MQSYKLKSAKYNGNSKFGVFNCLRQATGEECRRKIKNKQNIRAEVKSSQRSSQVRSSQRSGHVRGHVRGQGQGLLCSALSLHI